MKEEIDSCQATSPPSLAQPCGIKQVLSLLCSQYWCRCAMFFLVSRQELNRILRMQDSSSVGLTWVYSLRNHPCKNYFWIVRLLWVFKILWATLQKLKSFNKIARADSCVVQSSVILLPVLVWLRFLSSSCLPFFFISPSWRHAQRIRISILTRCKGKGHPQRLQRWGCNARRA